MLTKSHNKVIPLTAVAHTVQRKEEKEERHGQNGKEGRGFVGVWSCVVTCACRLRPWCASLSLSVGSWFLGAKPRHIDSVLYCHCIEDATFQTLHQKFLRLRKCGSGHGYMHSFRPLRAGRNMFAGGHRSTPSSPSPCPSFVLTPVAPSSTGASTLPVGDSEPPHENETELTREAVRGPGGAPQESGRGKRTRVESDDELTLSM